MDSFSMFGFFIVLVDVNVVFFRIVIFVVEEKLYN